MPTIKPNAGPLVIAPPDAGNLSSESSAVVSKIPNYSIEKNVVVDLGFDPLTNGLSKFFSFALKFSGGLYNDSVVTYSGNNIYGLPSNSDSQMMKNSEWGVVAYLSHSQYGINNEIQYNGHYITGCGEENYSSPTCGIPYGTPSIETNTYPQSTTGNIIGVFDLVGGTPEYVMGNYNNVIGGSGFITLPDRKYCDIYTILSNDSCTLSECGGHALYETKGWYSDYDDFVTSGSSWFIRSVLVETSVNDSGIFASDSHGGVNKGSAIGFRSVLVDGD